MIVEKLNAEMDVKHFLERLGVDGGGLSILASKAKIHLISIKNLHVGGANILKQDALSVGADLAVPRGTVIAKEPEVDSLLIATTAQLQKLSRKELAQPFGLQKVAKNLQAILSPRKKYKNRIMGIINANDDSFFSESRFLAKDALVKIEEMIEQGVEIIDIGGVSSRPNAPVVSVEEELSRVKPIFELIKEKRLYEKVIFSCDSYTPEVVEYAFESGFTMLNDITGLQDDALCQLAGKYKASVVIMHMQGTPQTMQKNPHYSDVVSEVYTFLEERVAKAKAFGIDEVIVDVGIGFGKSLEDNLRLLRNLEHFKTLDCELLIGASRKSMIHSIDGSDVSQRLGGTLAIHLEALRNGASILRVHDVFEHIQAIKVQERLETI